jgi:hypothetical protein
MGVHLADQVCDDAALGVHTAIWRERVREREVSKEEDCSNDESENRGGV